MKFRALLLCALTLAACKKQSAAPVPVPVSVPDAALAETPVAQTDAAPADAAPAAATALKPFLWKIDGKNGPTYLFGTIHLGVDPEKELPESVWKAFNTSKTFAMEADVSKIDMAQMMEKAMLTDGKKLSDHLTPSQMSLLSDLSGMPTAQLDLFQPWFASVAMLQKAAANLTTVGMDLVFQRKAADQKKNLVYFEDANEQIALLAGAIDGPALKEGLESMVKEGITNADALTNKLRELIAAYRTGDAQFDFAKFSGYTDEKLMERILYKRNRDWVPALEKLIAQGNGFVAVGVMHLLGKNSVLELLEKNGHKASRVE